MTTRPPTAFEISDLSKHFGAVQALSQAAFEAQPAEVHGLVGENGAGKSTLIRISTGLERPDAGILRHNGIPYAPTSPLEANLSGVRAVSQDFALAPNMSVAENLCLGSHDFLKSCRRGRFRWRHANDWAAEILRTHGIPIDPRRRVADLSVSRRQLVALARGLLDDPSIVFLDEPSSALDREGLAILYRLVDDLRARGGCVVYVSHKLDEIFDLTDRVTVLRDGHTIAAGVETNDVTESELISHMVGREMSQLFPARPSVPPVTEPVLRVHDLHAPGVHGVNLEVRPGEIVGVGGLVGAGRTEFAKALAGLNPVTRGRITVDGEVVTVRDRNTALKAGIEYMTEDRLGEGLFMLRPVAENLTARIIGRLRRGMFIDRHAVRAMADSMRDRFSIVAPSIDAPVGTLSGGNQQKALLAACLASSPRVVFLDEPTRGIDVGARAQIYDKIRELAQDRAIVVISAELIELLGLTDRIVIMREGRIVGEFVAREATEEDLVAAAIGRTAPAIGRHRP